jgi:hypothetical protein
MRVNVLIPIIWFLWIFFSYSFAVILTWSTPLHLCFQSCKTAFLSSQIDNVKLTNH